MSSFNAIVPINEQLKVKLTKPTGIGSSKRFFSVDLHIYWGTFYGGYEKKLRSFNGQKGWLRRVYLFCRILFYVRKDVACVFFRYQRVTFGDTLCIKILDRKFYFVTRSRGSCVIL